MARFPMLREKADAQASTLSGGQQKLLEVARGLLLEPKLMLIDEPSIGLSPLMVQEVFSILKDLRSAGVSILMIEQNARQALAISDYGLVLEQGQTRIEDTAAEHPGRSAHCPALPGRRTGSSDIGDIAMTSRMLVGLIGTNIQKSLAPALHEDAFAAAGVAGHYHLMDVSTLQGRRLEDLLAAARTAGFAGVNITHPFKEAVIPLLDAVSTEATEIGAVNTVVFDKSGRTTGHNTDCSGFRQAFIETFGADAVRGKPVLLLGAGGAGRAVAVALMALGASTVRIYDQDQARATGLCADLIMRFGADRCELSDRSGNRGRAGRGHRQRDARRHDRLSRPAAAGAPDPEASFRRRRDLHADRHQVRAGRPEEGLPHHERRRHVRAPGRRCLPPFHRPRARRRAHEADLRDGLRCPRCGFCDGRTEMKTAIATVCLSGALDDKLEAIANAGFERVELFENDLLSFNGSPADVRRMIEDYRLRTITFQPFRDFEGMPPALRERALTRAERKFDVMEALDCDLLMVCSNVSPDSLGGIDRAAADLRELGDRAARRGMRVAFEALAWGRHINDYRDAWEAVRRADHPAVGLVLDTFHILARGTDLSAIRAIPRDRIFLVQVADAPRLDMDYLSWSRHFRNFPGPGRLSARRLHGCARRHRLRWRCSRWRSSTTSSAAARRVRSRSTAIARSSICSTGCTRAPARSLPA